MIYSTNIIYFLIWKVSWKKIWISLKSPGNLLDFGFSKTVSTLPWGWENFSKKIILAIHELTLGFEFESYLPPPPSGLRKYFKKIFLGNSWLHSRIWICVQPSHPTPLGLRFFFCDSWLDSRIWIWVLPSPPPLGT